VTVITRKALPRRTFLRGAGVALALPLVEAMVPALTAPAGALTGPRRRVGFVYVPNGAIMEQWTPAASGPLGDLTPILQPLAPVRDRVVVVSNLTRVEPNNNHAVSSGCWLTGLPPRRTDGADFRAGTSLDQVIAGHIGQDTVFPSLEVATEDFSGLVGACDPGYSCAYMNTLNWQSPTTPLPMEINPRRVFDRMFGGGRTRDERIARMDTDRSILDFVRGDIADLERSLGVPDRTRVHEYLDHLREIERRIQRAEDQVDALPHVPEAPVGVPEAFEEHAELMFDLLALAFEADLTRVFTFMMAREVSQRTYPHIGVTEPHHSVSHYGNRREAVEAHAKINAYHVQLFTRFLERLQQTRDGESSLLEQSLILYGSGMSDGNGHTAAPLPLVLAGGAGGSLRGDRHVVEPQGTPMANLLLTIADRLDVPMEQFGASTGRVAL
jgi:hypothetical protein